MSGTTARDGEPPHLPDRIQYGGRIYERTGHGGTTKDGVYTHIDVSYRLVPSEGGGSHG